MNDADFASFQKALKLGHHKVATRIAVKNREGLEARGMTGDTIVDSFTSFGQTPSSLWATHSQCVAKLMCAGWKLSDDNIRKFTVDRIVPAPAGDIHPWHGESHAMVLALVDIHRLRPDLVGVEDLLHPMVMRTIRDFDCEAHAARFRKILRDCPLLRPYIVVDLVHEA